MVVSAVVPTWNEELWLPRLLSALSAEPSIDEVIVADNASTDGTREVASAFGCRIVEGGRPSVGRNRGAGAADPQNLLLFVDADVIPTTSALKSLRRPPSAQVVHHRVLPIHDAVFVRGAYRTADLWFRALALAHVRHGLTNFVTASRAAFEQVRGFDERIDPGEDVDFIRRAGRVTSVRYERSAAVFVSARRFGTERPAVFAAKTIIWEALRLAGVRSNPLPYRWVGHDACIAAQEEKWLLSRSRQRVRR
jgi:glycosyltransferase involved in cell wall biosynthesis